MFDKFGELGSYEEINELAENLFNEGDLQSIRDLAKENGIPQEYVSMYLEGDIPQLTDLSTAAIGKLEVEEKDMKPKMIMADWTEYIKVQAMENEQIAAGIRKKGKSLKGCMAELLKWSFKHQTPVDKDLIKAAGVSAGKVTLGIPGMAEAKKIIREYYGG